MPPNGFPLAGMARDGEDSRKSGLHPLCQSLGGLAHIIRISTFDFRDFQRFVGMQQREWVALTGMVVLDALQDQGAAVDRKSTRLNSSH